MGWTVEQVEQLRKMWAQGLTANEIAKKLGVTKNSIVGKVHRLCLQARPSPIKSKETEELKTENLSAAEINIDSEQTNKNANETVAESKEKNSDNQNENIKLINLDSHTCRWPIGDPRDEDFCFCGKKVRIGQTYCDEHSLLAYVKAMPKK